VSSRREEQDAIAASFGKTLARIRRRAGLSQEELSFMASLHRTEIGMLERGIRTPRIDTLVKLASSLEVSPGDLLDGLEWTPGNPRPGSFRVETPADWARKPPTGDAGGP
jgi:transcriptional regulator with XRE-family HTH domain